MNDLQRDNKHPTTPTPIESPPTDEQIHGKRRGSVISPVLSAATLFILGGIAISVGIYLTPFIVAAGHYVADSSNNNLTTAGDAIWAVFAPCLPYVLLGGVVAIVTRFSYKGAIQPLIATAIVLCVVTLTFHIYSPMLIDLGEKFNAKGLVDSPVGFAVFYFVLGLIAILVIVTKFGNLTGEK